MKHKDYATQILVAFQVLVLFLEPVVAVIFVFQQCRNIHSIDKR